MHENLKEQVFKWNVRFPVDRWWRLKHNVSFNSTVHRESNFLDQLFEYLEDKMFEDFESKEKYEPNKGDWLKVRDVSDEKRQDTLIKEARQEMSDLPKEF